VNNRTTSRAGVPLLADEQMHSARIFADYQHATWELHHIPWDSFRADLVKPEHIIFAKGAIIGESNVVAATHGLLNEFGMDYDFSQFTCIWGYQEIQHHLAFQTWLQLAGHRIEHRTIASMREAYPPGVTRAATLATNVICEVLATHAYKCVARSMEEPVLAEILRKASGDEARHAREFVHYTALQLAERPEELVSVFETLYIYMGTTRDLYRHPVSRFKGDLPELAGHETIDEMFAYFAEVDEDGTEWAKCCEQLFKYFSTITGYPLTKMADVRRAIVDESIKAEAAVG
jgi:hypothetical protein